MTDEYNLTWEQADMAMKLGAVVEAEELVPFRIKDDSYQGLFYCCWKNTEMDSDEKTLLYKIHSIPECEDNYKVVAIKLCGGKLFYRCSRCASANVGIEQLKKVCVDNFMKKLYPFNKSTPCEEPKMSEELISFDEAVVWMIRNKGSNLFFKRINKDCNPYVYYDDGCFMVSADNSPLASVINVETMRDYEFSKTPIKIEPKVNGLGLSENSPFEIHGVNDEERNIAIALATYIELLKHPLVVKAEQGRAQHVIALSGFSMSTLTTEDYVGNACKFDYLSPVFSSRKDAKEAISDIGEDKLLLMFKTIKGL